MRYVLVSFPEIESFMEHSQWERCIACVSTDGHPCPDHTYAVPEDLYNHVKHGECDNPEIVEIVEAVGKKCSYSEGTGIVVGYQQDYVGDVWAIIHRFDNLGWQMVDGEDTILLPQDAPSYWYIRFDELVIE